MFPVSGESSRSSRTLDFCFRANRNSLIKLQPLAQECPHGTLNSRQLPLNGGSEGRADAPGRLAQTQPIRAVILAI